MWVVLNKGFLSIVKKEGSYVVRAREEDHLRSYFPNCVIEHSTFTDYPFRIRLDEQQLQDFFESLPKEITYPNFKNSVKDSKLHDFCVKVWSIGYRVFN